MMLSKHLVFLFFILTTLSLFSQTDPAAFKAECEKERNAIVDKMNLLNNDWATMKIELKNGLFCSDCMRTKSEIDKTNVTFEEHIKAGGPNRHIVSATQAQCDSKYKEYLDKFNSFQKTLVLKDKSCDAGYKMVIANQQKEQQEQEAKRQEDWRNQQINAQQQEQEKIDQQKKLQQQQLADLQQYQDQLKQQQQAQTQQAIADANKNYSDAENEQRQRLQDFDNNKLDFGNNEIQRDFVSSKGNVDINNELFNLLSNSNYEGDNVNLPDNSIFQPNDPEYPTENGGGLKSSINSQNGDVNDNINNISVFFDNEYKPSNEDIDVSAFSSNAIENGVSDASEEASADYVERVPHNTENSILNLPNDLKQGVKEMINSEAPSWMAKQMDEIVENKSWSNINSIYKQSVEINKNEKGDDNTVLQDELIASLPQMQKQYNKSIRFVSVNTADRSLNYAQDQFDRFDNPNRSDEDNTTFINTSLFSSNADQNDNSTVKKESTYSDIMSKKAATVAVGAFVGGAGIVSLPWVCIGVAGYTLYSKW